ncbi:protein CHUP1, chloroplastic isoform X1 [Cynara cardunculus var. scolymus]|uniref:protein CHUP1, chloroplastic isoform X1 n=1 Tax=Cynara cardunculus var. scolymus TaxID=59895 RepID=UPI000D629D9E|nr:protein CHUP1, chloroplastic isoform X1 [Cynara cardunculus var. scolymus]
MIVRLGFLVAASIAAYAVKQVNVKSPPSSAPLIKSGGNDESTSEQHQREEEEKQHNKNSLGETEHVEEEEEKEEVKLISGLINVQPSNSDFEDDILPEFENLLSGEIDIPYPGDKYDTGTGAKAEKDRAYETELAINANELERLRHLVKELEEREVKLEGELLEYYGLKEQESDIVELQRQLKIKTVEIDMLNITINSLQTERKKLQEEVLHGASYKKELEAARNKIKELQRQFQLEANQTKGQLLLLKQQVGILQTKEQDAFKKDTDIDKKLKTLKELEVDVVELKRKNRELQHEKRQLVVKLDAAESRIATLSCTTETEMVASVREEVNKLKHTNDDLLKQVEGLQMNRFSEVEELVYLRWVNACLRFELRNYETPAGRTSARDLNKNLSPRSQEKAKQLMLEYAGSERGQGGDTDLESNFSQPSSPGSEDFDTASIDSSMSRYSSFSKKPSLIQKLKKWGKSKEDSSALSSPARSFSGGSPRVSISQKPRGPLEALMLRNAGESVAITTFGEGDQDSINSPETPNLPRINTGNAPTDLNNVASSFHLMSKSVEGVLDEKYPAYKDRHKLALEREKKIKEKADQARAVRFGDTSSFKPPNNSRPVSLPPKLAQVKERVVIPANTSGDQPTDGIVTSSPSVSKMQFAHIEKRPPRTARPPPRPTGGSPATTASPSGGISGGLPPPPPPPPGAPPPPPPPGGPPRPPPPPGSLAKGAGGGDKVHRAPELVEFYQSLMKREAKKDTSIVSASAASTADARSNMIGEIENRSTFLLAVKADVETQGDFVESLASEVRAASFTDIADLLTFVNWLDEELSFLVDERAVLKHFDWPEGKADAFREAAFEYQDLMKLEKQVSNFVDDPSLSCEAALKKMYKLLEKVENSVYALLRTRDMAMSRYKEFGIPVNWLQDSGVVGKIKLSSVQLARKYMKRVASELDGLEGPEKEPNREFLVLQGVRFAFRVHQFAGGFDAESMKAFEELRSRMNKQSTDEGEA